MYFLIEITAIICLLASITIYFQPGSELYLKIFPVYLFVTNIVQYVGEFLATHNKANTFIYNTFSILEFVFDFFILYQTIRNRQMKRVILSVLWLYPLFAIFNISFIQETSSFHSLSYAVGALLVVCFCIYYFYELFQLPHSTSLLREPAFWVCTAILFNNCTTFPLASFAIFIDKPTPFIIKNVAVIQGIINILSYLLFTIAFLCRIKTRKSISSS